MFTTHPVCSSVKTIVETDKKDKLIPIDMESLSKFIQFYFDENTNSLVIDCKVNVFLKTEQNIALVSKKDVVILSGNGLDENLDGEFRLNPSTPSRKY